MRANREIDMRVPLVEHVPSKSVPDVIRLRNDQWYFDYTHRWPHLCIRRLSGRRLK